MKRLFGLGLAALLLSFGTQSYADSPYIANTGVNIQNALIDSNGHAVKDVINSAPQNYTVFLGSVTDMADLANDVQQSLATGKIALYEHANGIAAMTAAQRQAVQDTWARTGVHLTGGNGGGVAVGEIGFPDPSPDGTISNSDSGYVSFFGGTVYPNVVTVNMPALESPTSGSYYDLNAASYTATSSDVSPGKVYKGYLTDKILAMYEQTFDGIVSKYKTKKILPFLGDLSTDTDDLWSNGAFYANYRKLALYTGGIALDFPPRLGIMNGDAQMRRIADYLKWGTDNHLEVLLLLSPYNTTTGGCGHDDKMLEETRAYVTRLRELGAIPTEYAIENYCGNPGPNANINGTSGDSDPESLNQIALWLATQPVSPPGTVVPQSAGGASQVGENPSTDAVNGFILNHSNTTLPSSMVSLVDLNASHSPLPTQALGDLAFQASYNFDLYSGTIGDGTILNDGISIFLNVKSSFVSQIPIIFQGNGGNPSIGGSSNDAFLYLTDPWTAESNIGISFGNDTNRVVLKRSATNQLIDTGDLIIQGTIYSSGQIVFTGGSGGNSVLSALSVDDYLHEFNPYTVDKTQIGFVFGNSSVKGEDPSITETADGTGLTTNFGAFTVDGTSVYGSGGTDVPSTAGNAWGVGFNYSGYLGEVDFFNVSGTGVGGYNFYTRAPGATTDKTKPILKIDRNGIITASGMTGTGNAFVCVDASGAFFRSATACVQ